MKTYYGNGLPSVLAEAHITPINGRIVTKNCIAIIELNKLMRKDGIRAGNNFTAG
jgi:hypothetical protein